MFFPGNFHMHKINISKKFAVERFHLDKTWSSKIGQTCAILSLNSSMEEKESASTPFLIIVPILYSLKTQKTRRFSGVFWGVEWEHWPEKGYIKFCIYNLVVDLNRISVAEVYQGALCERKKMFIINKKKNNETRRSNLRQTNCWKNFDKKNTTYCLNKY